MGEFARWNRSRRMSGWVTAWLFGVILMTGWNAVAAQSYAETLETGYCHCDLDNYLVNVRSAVMQGKPPPPMPASSTSTKWNSTGTSTTSGAPGSTAGSNNTTSSGTTGTAGTTGTVPGTSSNTITTTSATNKANDPTATTTTTKPGTTANSGTQTTTIGTATGTTQTSNSATTQTSSNTTTTQTSSNTTTTQTASNTTAATTAPTSASSSATTTAAGVTTTATTTTEKTTGKGQLKTDTTTTSGATTTTAAPAGRKKRDVAVVEIDHSFIKDVETLMETPVDYQYSPRVKRAASTGAELSGQKDPLYSFITQQVEYSGIKSASDSGIMYDENGKVSNCSCAPGSLVQLSICLLNVKYTSSLASATTDKHKEISNNLMYQLNIIMYQGLMATGNVKLFRRISLRSYEKRNEDGFTDAILDVLLSKKVYQAEYHVKNAIEPSVRSGELGPFITDAEKCVTTIDKTPPEPEKVHPLWYLKYLCLPIALIVLVVLVLFTCIGKKDAYYVRMW